jgi:hypothetical protein
VIIAATFFGLSYIARVMYLRPTGTPTLRCFSWLLRPSRY